MAIEYRVGGTIDLDEGISLYHRSTLGERRPVDDRERIAAMLRNANLIVSAWDGTKLVGLARSLTDWVYVTYLSDLAVDRDYQSGGLGRELVAQTRAACGELCMVVLLAAPQAETYYPKIGFTPHRSAWVMKSTDP